MQALGAFFDCGNSYFFVHKLNQAVTLSSYRDLWAGEVVQVTAALYIILTTYVYLN